MPPRLHFGSRAPGPGSGCRRLWRPAPCPRPAAGPPGCCGPPRSPAPPAGPLHHRRQRRSVSMRVLLVRSTQVWHVCSTSAAAPVHHVRALSVVSDTAACRHPFSAFDPIDAFVRGPGILGGPPCRSWRASATRPWAVQTTARLFRPCTPPPAPGLRRPQALCRSALLPGAQWQHASCRARVQLRTLHK